MRNLCKKEKKNLFFISKEGWGEVECLNIVRKLKVRFQGNSYFAEVQVGFLVVEYASQKVLHQQVRWTSARNG